MNHILFKQSDSYPVAILLKPSAFHNTRELRDNYVYPLCEMGMTEGDVIAFDLKINESGKVSVGEAKEYLAELLPTLQSIGTKILYVTDGTYFKALTGQTKSEPHLGYILPCKIKGFEALQIVYGINWQQLVYDPKIKERLTLSLQTLYGAFSDTHEALGASIIKYAFYASTDAEVAQTLEALHKFDHLTCDAEAFSIRFEKAGIGTVSFAWDEHHGCAFAVDYKEKPVDEEGNYGEYVPNYVRRQLLKKFFETYKGKITFHNASYDVKILIYYLWMDNLLDRDGMLKGLQIMAPMIHDTKIIAYLATNSTAGNTLSLKWLAHSFAGNWAVEEIHDIRKIPLPKLLQYNLVDSLSTFWTFKKYWPIMVQDEQLDIYLNMKLPSLKLLLSVELVGMPLSMPKILETETKLKDLCDERIAVVMASQAVVEVKHLLQWSAMEDANAKLKKKRHPLEAFAHIEFNPNSGPQLQRLIYEVMQLPVIDKTDSGLPATGGDTLEKLVNHTNNPEYKKVLTALMDYSKANKVLTAFIPAFKEAIVKGDDASIVWLHGSFKIGGTVSGRLSCAEPNLQQIPAGNSDDEIKAMIGKWIKECFMAPKGYIKVNTVGLDAILRTSMKTI